MITKLNVQLKNSEAGTYNHLSAQYRLNKIAREILINYCPFAKAIREDLKSNPMYQQALNDIETALALDSDNLLYYLEKGMLCYRVKFTDEGVRTMLKACELAPELADAHYLLGRLYMQQGNVPEARKSLETADKLGHPDARVQLDALE